MNEWYTNNGTSFSSFYKYYPERNNTLVRIRLATDRIEQGLVSHVDTGYPSIFVTPNTLVYSSPNPELSRYYSPNGYFEFDINRKVKVFSDTSGYYENIVVRNITEGDFMFDLTEKNILNQKCAIRNIHHGHTIISSNSPDILLPRGIEHYNLVNLANLAIEGDQRLLHLDFREIGGDRIYSFSYTDEYDLATSIKLIDP
jgi:hypothetical protein